MTSAVDKREYERALLWCVRVGQSSFKYEPALDVIAHARRVQWSLAAVGESDWTPQDMWASRLADAVLGGRFSEADEIEERA